MPHPTLHQHRPNILPVLVNNKDYCHLIIIILYTYEHISSACGVNIYKTKKLKIKNLKENWNRLQKNKIALKSTK